ncbi:unnamed protein product [Clavelina lepadiformis]|uniref:Uncharacterized protein n=1 Tax=Clavelina lepadiformis TaxID=159417 RepID=A0ABP0G8K5_CLALP
MEGLVSFTLEIVGWMLCNILEMNFVTALLSRLMLKRFHNYNEEKKKEVLVRFTSLLFVLKVAYSTIVFFMLTDHKIRKSHNIWGYYDFYKWILVMIVSYCFADILIHLIWQVKRKPWQYLHHIYGIGFGGFVILIQNGQKRATEVIRQHLEKEESEWEYGLLKQAFRISLNSRKKTLPSLLVSYNEAGTMKTFIVADSIHFRCNNDSRVVLGYLMQLIGCYYYYHSRMPEEEGQRGHRPLFFLYFPK